jgi:hypothetical protein
MITLLKTSFVLWNTGHRTDNYNLRRKKDDPQRKKHDPQTTKKGREADNEEENGFIMVSNKKAAIRTPPT